MSGGDLYPPTHCCCRNCSLRNSSSYPGFYGGGGHQEFRLTREMGSDIHNLVRSMSAFLEDVRVALGIEVKAGDVLGKTVMVNGAAVKPPVHGVNFDLAMRNDKPTGSSQEHDDGHGLNIADAVHRDGDGEGT